MGFHLLWESMGRVRIKRNSGVCHREIDRAVVTALSERRKCQQESLSTIIGGRARFRGGAFRPNRSDGAPHFGTRYWSRGVRESP